MASGERTYVDPSALLKLYLHEPDSAAVIAWRRRVGGPLPLTPHGRLEIVNGISLAAIRRVISAVAWRDALESFDEDLTERRYIVADIGWRAALRRAASISRAHTPATGCRTLDVLHVASALELTMRDFVTFDRRQQRLARLVGLKPIAPQ